MTTAWIVFVSVIAGFFIRFIVGTIRERKGMNKK